MHLAAVWACECVRMRLSCIFAFSPSPWYICLLLCVCYSYLQSEIKLNLCKWKCSMHNLNTEAAISEAHVSTQAAAMTRGWPSPERLSMFYIHYLGDFPRCLWTIYDLSLTMDTRCLRFLQMEIQCNIACLSENLS